MKHPTWFRVLEAARRLERRDAEFTGLDLAREAGVPDLHGVAWAGKLARWGYLVRTGTLASGPIGRPHVTFTVTKAGAAKDPPEKVRGTRTTRAKRRDG